MADDGNVNPQDPSPKEQANAMWGEINKGKTQENEVSQPVNPFESVVADEPDAEPDAEPEADTPAASDEPINPFAQPEATSEPEAVAEPQPAPPVNEPVNPFANSSQDAKPEPEPESVADPEPAPAPRNPFLDDDYDEDAPKQPESARSIEEPNEVHRATPIEEEKPVEAEMVEAEVVDRSPSEDLDLGAPHLDIDEDEDGKSEFWSILGQAGITKRSIFTALIVLGVLVLLILSFLFGWWGIFGFGDGASDDGGIVVEDVQDEPEVDVEEEVDQPETSGNAEDDFYSVITSYIVGMEFRPLENVVPIGQWGTFAPIETAFQVGLDVRKLRASSFVEYVDLLRDLENAFNTDVYALLDLAVEDRRGALEKHIGELNQLIIDGQTAVAELDGELISLNNEYVILVEERDRLEGNYFTQLDLMQGEAAYQNLLSFTDLSQQTVGIKAEFNGRSSLRDMLVDVLSYLIPRLEDIRANTEALVKGIRVFDIPRSNIDSIVPVEPNP